MGDILIVDDERDIRELIGDILEDEGFATRLAGNSNEAMAEVNTEPPALMILDIWLKDSKMDGIDILKTVKRDNPDIPVVIISGHGNIEIAVAAIKQGAYDFIEKPFNIDQLLVVIRRAMETSRLRRENQKLKRKDATAAEMVGESAAFRAWLGDTVLPMLRERYRHDGRALIIGESAAGHFVVETWLAQPDLFDGYAALSPSLQWDDRALAQAAPVEDGTERPTLFLSLADEGGDTEAGALELREKLGTRFCFADYRQSHVRHANSMHQLLPQALQYLLPTEADWLAEYGLITGCETLETAAD